MLMVGLALMGKVELVLKVELSQMLKVGVGYDGGGGAGVQLSSRKSRRCPAIFGFVSLPVRYPQTCQLCYHAPIYDL